MNQAVREVAERLGNTMAVCRKCYIHPAVVDGYLAGKLACHCDVVIKPKAKLRADEAYLLSYLTLVAGPPKRRAS